MTTDSPVRHASDQVALTEDDHVLLAALALGHTLESVAHDMDISVRTLRRRIRSVCSRLGVANHVQAIVWAVGTRRIGFSWERLGDGRIGLTVTS